MADKEPKLRFDAIASTEARDRAQELRKKIAKVQDDIPLGGKGYERKDGFYSTREERKDRAAAFDKLQNVREEEAEALEQRAKDAWGTKPKEEPKKYAKGGKVFKGYGKAKKV